MLTLLLFLLPRLTGSLLAAGATVRYTAILENKGNCQLAVTSATVTLPTGTAPLACPATKIPAGGTMTCTPIDVVVSAALFDTSILTGSLAVSAQTTAKTPSSEGGVYANKDAIVTTENAKRVNCRVSFGQSLLDGCQCRLPGGCLLVAA